MAEQQLLDDLKEIDKLLGRCTCPALRRDEHDAIRDVMRMVVARIQLSYKLEKELKEAKESVKTDCE